MATYQAFSDYGTQQQDIERRRKYAEMLQQQGMQPIEQQTAGGYVVPTSWTQGLAKALQAGLGGYQQGQLRKESEGLSQKRQQAMADAIGAMPRGTPGTAGVPEQSFAPEAADYQDNPNLAPNAQGQVNVPAQAGAAPQPASWEQKADWMRKLGAVGPDAVQIGTSILGMQQKDEENAENRAARADTAKQARDATMQQLQMRLADSRISAQEKNELTARLAAMQQESREHIAAEGNRTRMDVAGMVRAGRGGAGGPKPPVGYRFSSDGETLEPIPGGPKDGSSQKPLPTAALKLEQAERDAIGTSASISADLGAIDKLIDDKKLDLGLVSNLVSQGRNTIGQSNPQSVAFNTFKTTLERLRNDSLRLNKGVQTEGDSVRAWNELMGSLNDNSVVKDRLKAIREINDRGINLRKLNVDAIRANYGHPSADVSGYTNQPAAVGGSRTPTGFSDAEKERRYQEWKAKNGG